jgi:outer membrane immunogenic protein
MKYAFGGIGVAAVLAMAVPSALAADVSYPPQFYPPVPVFSWTSIYLGGYAGYGATNSDGVNANGIIGGGQLGYNYQFGYLVAGIEGDFGFADLSQGVTIAALGIPGAISFKENELGSVRARFGGALNNVLFYGTGGPAWGHVNLTVAGLGQASAFHSGWTAGGGVEWAFAYHWSVKAEYLHYGLSGGPYFGVGSGPLNIDTFKVGLNYLFQ